MGGRLGDLRMLVTGFVDLSAAAAAPPPPEPKPEPRREEAAAPAPAPASVPDPQKIYTSEDEGVSPATPIRQEVPRVPVQVANQTRERGILDVTIDEQGRVISAVIRRRPASHLRLADSRRRQRMALSAGDAQRPAREVPQDHPDHRHEALTDRAGGSLVRRRPGVR